MATSAPPVGQTNNLAKQVGQPGTETVASEDGALFLKLKKWVRDSLTKHDEWYKEARECYDFVAGRQWSDTDKDALSADGRVPIEFNRIAPIVDAVCGMEVNNRQEVKYLPRTMGASEADERLSSLADWARQECQAEDEESEGFRDTVICGRGWTETRIDFDEEPTGKIIVDRIDPIQAGVDPSAVKANFADSRYRWRYRDFDSDEAKGRFPGNLAAGIDASWARNITPVDGGEGNKRDYPDETRSALKQDEIAPTVCRVVMIQWWERKTAYMVAAPGSGEPVEVPEEQYLPMQADLEAKGVQAAKISRRTYHTAFLGKSAVLDQAEIDRFTLEAMTGKRDRNKGWHYGLVRPMRDPQRLANTTLANVLHILKTNAKGGLLAEKNAFANVRDAEKDWSNPSKTVLLSEGGLNKIRDRVAPQIPQALPALQEFSVSSIRDVTGVSVEMLGLADREQAASLEYQRRQSAMTILAPLFDALRRYRKTQGLVMISQLKKLPPGVLVRVIVGDQAQQSQHGLLQPGQPGQMPGQPQQQQQPGQAPQPQFVPFDPAAFGLSDDNTRFDVIVDEAPSSPNQKEAAWAVIQPMMGEILSNPAAMAVALKYSPLPSAAVKEFTDAITGQGNGIPPQVQQMIQAGQQRIAELEQQLKDKTGELQVKSDANQIRAYDSETKRTHVENQAMLEAVGHTNARMDQLIELHKAHLDAQQPQGAA